MLVQWYPGHMNKARKEMENDVRLVDLVIELLDARCPYSSRNPDIDRMAKNKDRLIILNKADLADERVSRQWKEYFENKGIKVVFLNCKNKEGLKNIMPAVRQVCQKRIEKNLKRGIKNQSIRTMVVGIPNVGKSTFINAFVGKNIAKTGNKPGVTVGKQWIKLSNELELLDTPGILWPKFDDQKVGKRLAYIGSINDEILIKEELAGDLLIYLRANYGKIIEEKYGINDDIFEPLNDDSLEYLVTEQSLMLEQVAKVRKCLKKGAEPDIHKAALLVIDEYRSGKLGKISLERP